MRRQRPNPDPAEPWPQHPEFARCSTRQINLTAANKRPSIVNTDLHRFAGVQVGHLHPRPQRQGGMGGGEGVLVIALAIGGGLAMEPGPIPGGNAYLWGWGVSREGSPDRRMRAAAQARGTAAQQQRQRHAYHHRNVEQETSKEQGREQVAALDHDLLPKYARLCGSQEKEEALQGRKAMKRGLVGMWGLSLLVLCGCVRGEVVKSCSLRDVPAKVWASIYLAMVPVYAFIDWVLPGDQFYHSTVRRAGCQGRSLQPAGVRSAFDPFPRTFTL